MYINILYLRVQIEINKDWLNRFKILFIYFRCKKKSTRICDSKVHQIQCIYICSFYSNSNPSKPIFIFLLFLNVKNYRN